MKKEYKEVEVSSDEILKTIDEYCNAGWKYLGIHIFGEYKIIFERKVKIECLHEWAFGYFYKRCIKCHKTEYVNLRENENKIKEEIPSYTEYTGRSNSQGTDNRSEILLQHPEYNNIAMDSNESWYLYKTKVYYDGDHWINSAAYNYNVLPDWKSVQGVVFYGKPEDSLLSKEKQKGWVKVNYSHIGKENLEIRVKFEENKPFIDLKCLDIAPVENKIYAIIDGKALFKNKNSDGNYYDIDFCEVLDELK